MTTKSTPKTINQKIADLNAQVEWFYGDDFELGQAPENYKKAIKLAKEIEKDLTDLRNEIEVVGKDFTKN